MLRMNGEQSVHSAHGETCRHINPFHRFVFVSSEFSVTFHRRSRRLRLVDRAQAQVLASREIKLRETE